MTAVRTAAPTVIASTGTLSPKTAEEVRIPATLVRRSSMMMIAANANAMATRPTDSNIKLNINEVRDTPKILYVFTDLNLAGTSAKKKLMKFINAMRMMSTATASNVISVVRFPVRPGLPSSSFV